MAPVYSRALFTRDRRLSSPWTLHRRQSPAHLSVSRPPTSAPVGIHISHQHQHRSVFTFHSVVSVSPPPTSAPVGIHISFCCVSVTTTNLSTGRYSHFTPTSAPVVIHISFCCVSVTTTNLSTGRYSHFVLLCQCHHH